MIWTFWFSVWIVESRGTIRANETYRGEDGEIKIVVEENERYII